MGAAMIGYGSAESPSDETHHINGMSVPLVEMGDEGFDDQVTFYTDAFSISTHRRALNK